MTRVVGYVRVSDPHQIEGFSLDAQRRLIKVECERADHELLTILSDEGESAKHDSLAKRPGFRAAIEMVESRRADALMVHKLDRAARNLYVLLDVVRRTEGNIISIVETGADAKTPHGKMVLQVMGAIAEFYSANLGQEISKGKDQRRRNGLWNGRVPFGLRTAADGEAGVLLPDTLPVLSTIADHREWSRYGALRHIFALAAEGRSLPVICREMLGIGFRFHTSTVHQIVRNRIYLGEVPLTERKRAIGWLPAQHAGVINIETFERAAEARGRNRHGYATVRTSAHVYALTGIVRCGRCGGRMYCHREGKSPDATQRIYCGNARTFHTCDQPSLKAAPIEATILEWLDDYSIPRDHARAVARRLHGTQPDTRRALAQLDARLKRLRDLYDWGDLPAEEYVAKKRACEHERAALAPRDTGSEDELVNWLTDLPAYFRSQDEPGRNRLVSRLFTEIVVDGKALAKYKPNPLIDAVLRDKMANPSVQLQSAGRVSHFPLGDGYWQPPASNIAHQWPTKIPRAWWPEVVRLKAEGVTYRELAARFDCVPATVWKTLQYYRVESEQS